MLGGGRGIFYKGNVENLVQHKVNENILRYKLEAYQKNFPHFIYGSLASIKILG
jgi:hypothetical protein